MSDLPSLGVSANERRSRKASRTIAKSDDSGSWQSSQCPQVPPTSGELAITERRVHSAATLDLDEVPLFWRPRPRGVFSSLARDRNEPWAPTGQSSDQGKIMTDRNADWQQMETGSRPRGSAPRGYLRVRRWLRARPPCLLY
ncbi:hypothetical protein CGCSCA5_v011692 [Colletotrichum siamense]|nr:hypothetical protein CGCSCA5_v011692 [Colletotrichum siamense]